MVGFGQGMIRAAYTCGAAVGLTAQPSRKRGGSRRFEGRGARVHAAARPRRAPHARPAGFREEGCDRHDGENQRRAEEGEQHRGRRRVPERADIEREDRAEHHTALRQASTTAPSRRTERRRRKLRRIVISRPSPRRRRASPGRRRSPCRRSGRGASRTRSGASPARVSRKAGASETWMTWATSSGELALSPCRTDP